MWDLKCPHCGFVVIERDELPEKCPNKDCPSHDKKFEPEGDTLLERVFSWKDHWKFAFVPGQEILDKIQKIEKNGSKCLLYPNRVCPCEQSAYEVVKEGYCGMQMFCTYPYAHSYNLEFDLTDDAGVRIPDKERLALQREKDREQTEEKVGQLSP